MKHDATQSGTEARNVIRLTDDQVKAREFQYWLRADDLNQIMRFQTLLEQMLRLE